MSWSLSNLDPLSSSLRPSVSPCDLGRESQLLVIDLGSFELLFHGGEILLGTSGVTGPVDGSSFGRS